MSQGSLHYNPVHLKVFEWYVMLFIFNYNGENNIVLIHNTT